MRPLVSILFPCYNAGKYLSYALESILNQYYANLEIICVNDGSTDETPAMLESYQSADTRIRVINNSRNLGLIASLNRALEEVKGEFFARMDADDYCPPDRISKQMDFIMAHREYDLISTGYRYFIKDGQPLEYVPPVGTCPDSLKFISLFSTPLTHASALGRSSLIKSGLYRYDINFQHSEDYELFSRLAWNGISMANLPEPLYWVRLNPESVSNLHNTIQIESHLRITRRNLENQLFVNEKLDDNIIRIVSNRIDISTRIREINNALTLLKTSPALAENRIKPARKERKEISGYLKLHSLNILIQSNKAGFALRGIMNTGFFFRSMVFLRPGHFRYIFRKIFNYFWYRLY